MCVHPCAHVPACVPARCEEMCSRWRCQHVLDTHERKPKCSLWFCMHWAYKVDGYKGWRKSSSPVMFKRLDYIQKVYWTSVWWPGRRMGPPVWQVQKGFSNVVKKKKIQDGKYGGLIVSPSLCICHWKGPRTLVSSLSTWRHRHKWSEVAHLPQRPLSNHLLFLIFCHLSSFC